MSVQAYEAAWKSVRDGIKKRDFSELIGAAHMAPSVSRLASSPRFRTVPCNRKRSARAALCRSTTVAAWQAERRMIAAPWCWESPSIRCGWCLTYPTMRRALRSPGQAYPARQSTRQPERRSRRRVMVGTINSSCTARATASAMSPAFKSRANSESVWRTTCTSANPAPNFFRRGARLWNSLSRRRFPEANPSAQTCLYMATRP